MRVVHESCGHNASGVGRCKACYNRAYYAEKKETWPSAESRRIRYATDYRDPRRVHFLKNLYGLSPEDYKSMLDAQGGTCAICGSAPEGRLLSVDHDHETGMVRALLCTACNTILGHAKDQPQLLQVAIAYLESWS